jgi:glutathione S-transferase
MPESFEEYLANGATLPEVLAINPRGKFPALEDRSTGLVLAESAAINTYLGDKYGDGSIVPRAGSNERALYDQWCYWL